MLQGSDMQEFFWKTWSQNKNDTRLNTFKVQVILKPL